MLSKTYEFLYETQNQTRPSFLVYLCEKKTLIVIAIAIFIGISKDIFWGIVVFIFWLWYDIPRITIFRTAKLTNKHNLYYFINLLISRFYRKNNTELSQILAEKILVEKKDEKDK